MGTTKIAEGINLSRRYLVGAAAATVAAAQLGMIGSAAALLRFDSRLRHCSGPGPRFGPQK
jgi:hypothetical protein